MYEELINLLRRCGKQKCKDCEYEHVLGCVTNMNEKAADAIEELQKAEYFHKYNSEFWEDKYNSLADEKWIPVTERLPREQETVLTWGKQGAVLLDWRHDNKWCCFGGVTHWMPLPEPPKESES